MERIIIVGAGIAAVSAAKAIRQANNDIEIHIYGEERYLPYKRIRLTKDLVQGFKPEEILIQKESWYSDNNIRINTGARVKEILPKDHKVKLSDGSEASYSKLLLANGAVNFTPPITGIGIPGVFTLRDLNDAEIILKNAEAADKALIIGGGVLGLEVAWCLKQLNKAVTVVEALPRLMPRQLDEEASLLLLSIIKSFDVEVHLETQVKEITGVDSVTGFVTNNDLEDSCDIVIHSTGIKPNVAITEGTGIEIKKGILVNNKMETSIPDIYAAGDVAEFEHMVYGLWNIASAQGETAGFNMAGQHSEYMTPPPATLLNAFNYTMFSIGDVDSNSADIVITDQNLEERVYKKVLFKDNQIIGAVFMGSNKEFPQIKRAMENELEFTEAYDRKLTIPDILLLIKDKQANKKEAVLSK